MEPNKFVRCKDCTLAQWTRGADGGISHGGAGRCGAEIPPARVVALCFAEPEHVVDFLADKIGIWPDFSGPCDFFQSPYQERQPAPSAEDDKENLPACLQPKRIDEALDQVLRAVGNSLQQLAASPSTLDAVRRVITDVMTDSYVRGNLDHAMFHAQRNAERS
jgi:hypothetical protein